MSKRQIDNAAAFLTNSVTIKGVKFHFPGWKRRELLRQLEINIEDDVSETVLGYLAGVCSLTNDKLDELASKVFSDSPSVLQELAKAAFKLPEGAVEEFAQWVMASAKQTESAAVEPQGKPKRARRQASPRK
jgi:hypothetical protein